MAACRHDGAAARLRHDASSAGEPSASPLSFGWGACDAETGGGRAGAYIGDLEIDREVCAREGDATTLVFETTGASAGAIVLLGRLRARFDVVLVRVVAGAGVCDERMATRDQSAQIQVDPVMVRALFERSIALDLSCALTIDNSGDRGLAAVVADVAGQLALERVE